MTVMQRATYTHWWGKCAVCLLFLERLQGSLYAERVSAFMHFAATNSLLRCKGLLRSLRFLLCWRIVWLIVGVDCWAGGLGASQVAGRAEPVQEHIANEEHGPAFSSWISQTLPPRNVSTLWFGVWVCVHLLSGDCLHPNGISSAWDLWL